MACYMEMNDKPKPRRQWKQTNRRRIYDERRGGPFAEAIEGYMDMMTCGDPSVISTTSKPQIEQDKTKTKANVNSNIITNTNTNTNMITDNNTSMITSTNTSTSTNTNTSATDNSQVKEDQIQLQQPSFQSSVLVQEHQKRIQQLREEQKKLEMGIQQMRLNSIKQKQRLQLQQDDEQRQIEQKRFQQQLQQQAAADAYSPTPNSYRYQDDNSITKTQLPALSTTLPTSTAATTATTMNPSKPEGSTTAEGNTNSQVPKGILYPPRALNPRAPQGRNVRWKDQELSRQAANRFPFCGSGPFASCPHSRSVLEDVMEDSGKMRTGGSRLYRKRNNSRIPKVTMPLPPSSPLSPSRPADWNNPTKNKIPPQRNVQQGGQVQVQAQTQIQGQGQGQEGSKQQQKQKQRLQKDTIQSRRPPAIRTDEERDDRSRSGRRQQAQSLSPKKVRFNQGVYNNNDDNGVIPMQHQHQRVYMEVERRRQAAEEGLREPPPSPTVPTIAPKRRIRSMSPMKRFTRGSKSNGNNNDSPASTSGPQYAEIVWKSKSPKAKSPRRGNNNSNSRSAEIVWRSQGEKMKTGLFGKGNKGPPTPKRLNQKQEKLTLEQRIQQEEIMLRKEAEYMLRRDDSSDDGGNHERYGEA